MARELSQIMAELHKKIVGLAAQRDDARRECAVLAKKADDLSDMLDQCRKELEKSRMEVDFLTVAQRADDPDNLISARRRVQRLIAKIDRCVALLREDADIN